MPPETPYSAATLAHFRHDLRTPVNAIIGYSEMLLEDAEQVPSADAVAILQEINQLGRQLNDAISDLLSPDKVDQTAVDLAACLGPLRQRLTPPTKQVWERCQALLDQPALAGLGADLERIRVSAERLQEMLDRVEPSTLATTPMAAPPPIAADDAALDEIVANAELERHGHILVVDDNPFNRDILARGLYRQQYHFALAGNGRQALDMLQSHAFDLVLLDIMMPEMDGFETLARIKADPQLQHVPVIMISALDQVDSVVRCIEMGAEDYLPKPFDPVLLRARTGACLEKKRLRDQELDYLRNVAAVTAAAAAVEAGAFDPAHLEAVAARTDPLGQLARVFQSMAHEVRAREQRLQMQVEQLRIEIDESRKAKQVAEITETDYFQELQQKAQDLKKRRK